MFVVVDAADSAQANAYVNTNGPTFGWRTNDADNTVGPGTVAFSSLFSAYPWTGVVRTSDMQLMYDEPDTSYLDIEAIAVELASD